MMIRTQRLVPAVILICSWFLSACADTTMPLAYAEKQKLSLSWAEAQSVNKTMDADPLVQRLDALIKEVSKRASERGVSTNDAIRAGRARGTAAAGELLGYVPGELEAIDAEIASLLKQIISKYPAVQAQVDGRLTVAPRVQIACGESGQSFTAAMCEGELDETNCNWLLYTAALVACTAAGPVLYWACALLAWCEFCTSELHEAICFSVGVE